MADNLQLLASRDLPSPYRFDKAGELRLIIPVVDPVALIEILFGPLRSYGAADYMTLNHILKVLNQMSRLTNNPVFRQALFDEADRLRENAKSELSGADYAKLTKAYGALRETVPA